MNMNRIAGSGIATCSRHTVRRIKTTDQVCAVGKGIRRDKLPHALRLIIEIPAEETSVVGKRPDAVRNMVDIAVNEGGAVESDECPQSRRAATVEIGAARRVVTVTLPAIEVNDIEPCRLHRPEVPRRNFIDAKRENRPSVLVVAPISIDHHSV